MEKVESITTPGRPKIIRKKQLDRKEPEKEKTET